MSVEIPEFKMIAESWHESSLEELKNLWCERKKEMATKEYQPYIDRYIAEFFDDKGSKAIFERVKTAISVANSKEQLTVPIFDYLHTVVEQETLSWPFKDMSGKQWNQLHMFIEANSYKTTVQDSYVEVDFLVRKTHMLKQMDALFGNDHFRVKVVRNTYLWNERFVVEMCEFMLDYFPDGVPGFIKR
jgi:uncharacterized membrane protein YheB (UPF0754 family)